jgi:hypothetical protein
MAASIEQMPGIGFPDVNPAARNFPPKQVKAEWNTRK